LKVYSLRKPYVELHEADSAKYMSKYDMAMLGVEAQAALAEEEVGGEDKDKAKEGKNKVTPENVAVSKPVTPVPPAAASSEGKEGDPKQAQPVVQKPKEKRPYRDYSNLAMKQLSMAERSEKGMRDEGYEHGEIEPAAFFNFLYKLKTIHGHMIPPPKVKKTEKETKEKKKKGEEPEEHVITDSFFDLVTTFLTFHFFHEQLEVSNVQLNKFTHVY
jgi:hypothetical protein